MKHKTLPEMLHVVFLFLAFTLQAHAQTRVAKISWPKDVWDVWIRVGDTVTLPTQTFDAAGVQIIPTPPLKYVVDHPPVGSPGGGRAELLTWNGTTHTVTALESGVVRLSAVSLDDPSVTSYPFSVVILPSQHAGPTPTPTPKPTPKFYTISGTITDQNGQSMTDVVVTLSQAGTDLSTDYLSPGTYVFSNVAPGRYSLTATKTGWTFNGFANIEASTFRYNLYGTPAPTPPPAAILAPPLADRVVGRTLATMLAERVVQINAAEQNEGLKFIGCSGVSCYFERAQTTVPDRVVGKVLATDLAKRVQQILDSEKAEGLKFIMCSDAACYFERALEESQWSK